MSAIDALCRALGVVWAYVDGAGRDQCAPVESRLAVLRALGLDITTEADAQAALDALPPAPAWQVLEPGARPDPGTGTDWRLLLEGGDTETGTGALPPLPPGRHRLEADGTITTLLVAPPRLPRPARAWGLTVPLYGLWEGAQAGPGSYTALADLARAVAPLGAGFLGLNPVHAGFDDPLNYSPYAPSHRRRWNVLHIDAAACHADTGALVDYARARATQRAALRARYAAFAGDPAFDRWRAAEGATLQDFATHQALSDRHGPYWPDWPAALQSPDSPDTRRFAQDHADALRFHAWCQWQAEAQLGAARDAAAGMAHGLYLDLAVGTHPAGAETWAEPALFARTVSLGAPPDLLAPLGQRWGLAPMDPRALAATGFAALAETLRQQLRFAGVLRIDHILGFERAFWVPEGDLPGVYVQMPREALLAVARIEAARAGATVVGEDLGTVPDGLRARLGASGILGCRCAMFDPDLPARAYSDAALTSFSTHDLPTWAGWRAGRDVDWREALAEMTPAQADTARAARRADVARFDATAGTCGADPVALHAHLARTPAPLVAFQAEDICGVPEQPNLPGTIFEHPNWRRRLPLPVSALAAAPALRDSAAAFDDPHPSEARP